MNEWKGGEYKECMTCHVANKSEVIYKNPDYIFECSFCKHRVYVHKYETERVVTLSQQTCPHCTTSVSKGWILVGHGDRQNVEQAEDF